MNRRFFLLSLCLAAAAAAHPAPQAFLDAAAGYAVIEDGAAFDLDAFTLAAWVKLDGHASPQIFLLRGARGELFSLYAFKGVVRMLVEYAPGRYTHADAPLPEPGVWTHYLGTYDGKTVAIYKDGRLAHRVEAKGRIPVSKAPLYIAAQGPLEGRLQGRIGAVQIWNRALDADQAAAVHAGQSTAPEALVAAYMDAPGADVWASATHALDAAVKTVEPGRWPVRQAGGYRGIWYFNQPSNDEYVYKYSGGLGTYCAKHFPFAIYAPAVDKTFFCYGGTAEDKRELLHMVSYYDHAAGVVPRPTLLLNKHTDDAHDNPVIQMDDTGHIWIFSSSHGAARPSYISRSVKPYDVAEFEHVSTTNFSYPQPHYIPGRGFLFLHTRYAEGRNNYVMTSPDGRAWSEGVKLAKIHQGHYQVSGQCGDKVGMAFNYHPDGKGLNWRTNLYYMETADFAASWRSAGGAPLEVPLTTVDNPALVHDYQAEGLNVYMKDCTFDAGGRPVILYVTSKGYQSGPENGPRTWTTARWDGAQWHIHGSITSDNNYDTGMLNIEPGGAWRLFAPTETGPQPYNPGGEMALWLSTDQGVTWRKERQLTQDSPYNHTYARRVLNAHPEFYAFWADGHGRKPSESRLYFCDQTGENVWRLPQTMDQAFAKPIRVGPARQQAESGDHP